MRAEIEPQKAGVVEGYAALFGKFNQHNDLYLPGCFAEAIKERHERPDGSRLTVNWMHEGERTCFVPLEVREDETGLWTVAQLVDHEGANRDIWRALEARAVTGLSIEFNPWKTDQRWLGPSEYKMEDLGTPDDFWFAPRAMQKVALLGWGYVDHPSADDARVKEVRRILTGTKRAVQGWRPEHPATPSASAPQVDPQTDPWAQLAQDLETQRAASLAAQQEAALRALAEELEK